MQATRQATSEQGVTLRTYRDRTTPRARMPVAPTMETELSEKPNRGGTADIAQRPPRPVDATAT